MFNSTTPLGTTTGTHYFRPTATDPLHAIIDAGNIDVKAMLFGNFGEEVVFAHSIRQPSPAEYAGLASSYQNRPANFSGTAIFSLDGVGYVVGNHAAASGNGISIVGPEKYRRDHLGVLVAAALLRLYPEGHNNVRLVILHPAKMTAESIEALKQALLGPAPDTGKHGEFVLSVPGRPAPVRFRIRELILNEEAVCALNSWLLTIEGQPYKQRPVDLQPGQQILSVDIGGWLSYIGYALVNDQGGIEPNTQGGAAIQTGIMDVRDAFEMELKQAFPQLNVLQDMSDRWLFQALHDRRIRIGDEEVDCSRQVDLAFGVMYQKLAGVYGRRFQRGMNVIAIVVSGGGAASAFDFLCRTLFADRTSVYPAEEDRARLRYSAIRGASKMLPSFLKRKGQLNGGNH